MTYLRIALFCIILSSCLSKETKEEKLKNQVRSFLTSNLNDYRNYFPLSYEINERFAKNGLAADMRREHLTGFVMACCMEKKLGSTDPDPSEDSLLLCCWKVKHRFVYKNNSGILRDSLLTFYIDTTFRIHKIE